MAIADEKVFLWINSLVGRFTPFDRVMEWVVSDYLIPVSLALALVGLWFVGRDEIERKKHQIGVFVALSSMGFSSLTVFVINSLYTRPRPFDGLADEDISLLFYRPTDSSFPANPAAASFGIAIAVWCVNRRLGSVLLVGAGLYGFARVYAGVHYPLDVIIGAMIAVVVTYLVFKLRDLLEPIPTWVIKTARILCLA
ncbi:MAG: phosphatase PAP2 family protein [SAR202 cluster bacterium]|nr:phosphatase PAP2 family protein [SAR202 cluster bacterium]